MKRNQALCWITLGALVLSVHCETSEAAGRIDDAYSPLLLAAADLGVTQRPDAAQAVTDVPATGRPTRRARRAPRQIVRPTQIPTPSPTTAPTFTPTPAQEPTSTPAPTATPVPTPTTVTPPTLAPTPVAMNPDPNAAGCAGAPAAALLVDARSMGAAGDGVTDDTVALQAAVDAVANTGGTLVVPAGTYLIDAVRALRLKSDMTLRLEPDAVLRAKPNGSPNYSTVIIKSAQNVTVVGGTIEGERSQHTGTTGEWGHSLQITSSRNVVVDSVTAREAWGDGFYLSGSDSDGIVLCRLLADHNRRQGMSIVAGRNITLRDSIFRNTEGTAPELGLDIEPNRGDSVDNVLVERNTFTHNLGGGISIGSSYSDPNANVVTHTRLVNNLIQDNGRPDPNNLSRGILLSVNRGNTVEGNRIIDNMGVGISILYTHDTLVKGNTVSGTTLTGRYAEIGAGIDLEFDQGTLCTENTVTGNETHGIFQYQSGATVVNNNVFGNGRVP